MTNLADETTTITTNGAVFFQHGKRTRAHVTVNGSLLRVSMNDGAILFDYEIVEVVKEGMAWDVLDSGIRARLVVQDGCGCGGMRAYSADPSYSGALRN